MSEWISVDDELPKDKTMVLALSVHKAVYATWYVQDDIEFFPYAHSASFAPIGEVTHWMPLPDLPK